MKQSKLRLRICVYGIGGVGGYFGSIMAKTINENAAAGYACHFIARGAHLAAIRRDGIKVVSPDGTRIGRPTGATDDMREVPDPDLILLCVKAYDLDAAVRSIRSKVGENTVVIPLLNGADIYDRIRTHLDMGIVLPACVFVGTHIQEPGVIHQSGGDGRILFGKDPRLTHFDPAPVTGAFDDLGINYQWSDNPFPAIWTKYIFIAAFGLVTVHTGKCLGEIMTDGAARQTVRAIMEEIKAIAAAKGIPLPVDIVEASIDKANNFPYETKTSYQRDVEAKGALNEGDIYGGTIIKAGTALNVPTPVTRMVYAEIQDRLKG